MKKFLATTALVTSQLLLLGQSGYRTAPVTKTYFAPNRYDTMTRPENGGLAFQATTEFDGLVNQSCAKYYQSTRNPDVSINVSGNLGPDSLVRQQDFTGKTAYYTDRKNEASVVIQLGGMKDLSVMYFDNRGRISLPQESLQLKATEADAAFDEIVDLMVKDDKKVFLGKIVGLASKYPTETLPSSGALTVPKDLNNTMMEIVAEDILASNPLLRPVTEANRKAYAKICEMVDILMKEGDRAKREDIKTNLYYDTARIGKLGEKFIAYSVFNLQDIKNANYQGFYELKSKGIQVGFSAVDDDGVITNEDLRDLTQTSVNAKTGNTLTINWSPQGVRIVENFKSISRSTFIDACNTDKPLMQVYEELAAEMLKNPEKQAKKYHRILASEITDDKKGVKSCPATFETNSLPGLTF